MRTAFITGITGQDGSYLAELLLAKGYEVHGLVRHTSSFNTSRIDHLHQDPHDPEARLFLHHGDIQDAFRLATLIARIEPDEVYNLAGQAHVGRSFDQAALTGEVSGVGAVRLLEALRASGSKARFFQASSAEMFGSTPPPLTEDTPPQPSSPHGAAKAYAYWATRASREAYDMYAVNGISFNHESPRRGEGYLTRKVTRAVARIQAGLEDYLYLGNLDIARDWGYAPEYVAAMWQMLQADEPTDYVLATGTATTVRDFVTAAFDHAGLDWEKHVRHADRFVRPIEIHSLIGEASKAARDLGWKATVQADQLARIMVEADIAALEAEGGYWIDRVDVAGWPQR